MRRFPSTNSFVSIFYFTCISNYRSYWLSGFSFNSDWKEVVQWVLSNECRSGHWTKAGFSIDAYRSVSDWLIHVLLMLNQWCIVSIGLNFIPFLSKHLFKISSTYLSKVQFHCKISSHLIPFIIGKLFVYKQNEKSKEQPGCCNPQNYPALKPVS